MINTSIQTSGNTAPDWANTNEEILCPLCDYNLRGLEHPRCPECGYEFEWRDLLDPTRRKHPYLFEHHPRRNIWSFFKTLMGGLRPKRFWRTLHPGQPSKPKRLVGYYLLTTLVTATLALSMSLALAIYFVYFRGTIFISPGRNPPPNISPLDLMLDAIAFLINSVSSYNGQTGHSRLTSISIM